MAALSPALSIKLDLDPAGVLKGVTITQKALGTLGSGLGKTSSKAEGLRRTLGAMWRITGGIILFNIIRKVTQGLEALIKVGLDFEEQMYNINSVAQMGAKGLQNLTDQVIDLALDPRVKDGPAKLAAGLYTIASAGYSTADALIIMEQSALASTAGMTTSAVAADVLISTLGAYNLTAKDAAFVTNQLFQIVNISKYTFEQLGTALATVTPSAANLGIGIDQVGAAMATFAARGKSAQTATVEMNAILTGLLKPTDAMTEQLNAMGFASGEAMIETLGFTKTMQVFAQVIDGSADKAAALFGDIRALRGIQTLTNDGAVLLTENLIKMGDAQKDGGAMTRALTEQMKSNAFQISVLRKNIQVLAVLGFGMIAPYLNKVLNGVNAFVAGMVISFRHFRDKGYDFFDSLRAAAKTVITDMFGPEWGKKANDFVVDLEKTFFSIKSIVIAVFPIVVDSLKTTFKIIDMLSPALVGLGTSFLIFYKIIPAIIGVRKALLALRVVMWSLNPWFIAIAIVVAAFYYMYTKNLFGIRETTKVVIDFVVEAFQRFMMIVKGGKGLGKALEGLPAPIQKLAILLRRTIKTVTDFFRTFRDQGAIAAFRELSHNFEKIGRTIGNFFKSIGLDNFGEQIKVPFRLIGKLIREVVSLVDNVIHGRWSRVWKDFKDIAVLAVQLWWQQFVVIGALLYDVFQKIPWKAIGEGIWNGFKSLLEIAWEGLKMGWKIYVRPWLEDRTAAIMISILKESIKLYNGGRDIVSAIWDGMASLFSWVEFQIWQLPHAIITGVNATMIYLYNLGRNIVGGIWDGIVSLTQWFHDSIIAWAKSVIPDPLERFFGIASHSKLMVGYGKNIILGLADGINEGIPDLVRSMDRVNVATSPAGIRLGTPSLARRGASAFAPLSSAETRSREAPSTTFHFSGPVHIHDGPEEWARKTMQAKNRRNAGRSPWK